MYLLEPFFWLFKKQFENVSYILVFFLNLDFLKHLLQTSGQFLNFKISTPTVFEF